MISSIRNITTIRTTIRKKADLNIDLYLLVLIKENEMSAIFQNRYIHIIH